MSPIKVDAQLMPICNLSTIVPDRIKEHALVYIWLVNRGIAAAVMERMTTLAAKADALNALHAMLKEIGDRLQAMAVIVSVGRLLGWVY